MYRRMLDLIRIVRPALVLVLPLAVGCLISKAAADAPTYELRYKFQPGEKIRTKVVHQAAMETQIDGSKQTAETVSISVKVWDIQDVDKDGKFKFVHSVERVDMKNTVTGREPVHYDSTRDETPPPEFAKVAQRVGVPLTVVTMNDRGEVLVREEKAPKGLAAPGQMTIPLPERPVRIGDTWSFPQVIPVKLRSGLTKQINTKQRFRLEEVSHGVATIEMDTQVLTPTNNDPEIEAALVQRISEGTIRFDLDAGRVLSQQVDLDRRVVGFPNASSVMHYRTRFTEKTLAGSESTAEKPSQDATR